MSSISLLTRLGVAIEKIGKRIAEVGSGREVHAQTADDMGYGRSVAVCGNGNQSYSHDAIYNRALGKQVNEYWRNAVIENVKCTVANLEFTNSVISAHSQPSLSELNARSARGWRESRRVM